MVLTVMTHYIPTMGIHGQKSMKILVLMSGRYWQRSCSWWSQGLLAKRLKHLMKLMSTKRSGLKQPESHHFSDAWGWQPPNTGGAMYFLLRFAIWCYQFIAYHIDFVIFYSPQVQGRPFCNMPNFLGNTNLDLNINLTICSMQTPPESASSANHGKPLKVSVRSNFRFRDKNNFFSLTLDVWLWAALLLCDSRCQKSDSTGRGTKLDWE